MTRAGLNVSLLIVLIVVTIAEDYDAPTTRRRRRITDKTTRHYDPNHAYEQYWPGGDWKLFGKTVDPTTTVKGEKITTTRTTPKPISFCGDECPTQYNSIKQVCTVHPYSNWHTITGYKTMSYCDFLMKSNPQCREHDWWNKQLIFVHLGSCLDNYVQGHPTPWPSGSTHPKQYTPNIFELEPRLRLTKFIQKFYNAKEWTKFYSGAPYDVSPFENLP